MNKKTLHKISYGLYIISSIKEGKLNGQIANTVFQITSEPPTMAISINKENLTHEYIRESKLLTVSILDQSAPMTLIGKFGFKTGREIDKFIDTKYKLSNNGVPIIEEAVMGFLEGEVIQEVDMGSHTIFIARVTDADITKDVEPMNYAYYHQVKNGKAPKTAPTYIEEDVKKSINIDKYTCSVCGYVYDPEKGDEAGGIKPGVAFEELPEAWLCPICGVGKSEFVKE
ncbi:MAG: High molecular weight rubredoxin [Firmicutes bacterium HGW-Firmicutes-12]|nr:MAG: High molecular weight rubredoxin [Firmicutes bacterium HGW-Firmicutes-12]